MTCESAEIITWVRHETHAQLVELFGRTEGVATDRIGRDLEVAAAAHHDRDGLGEICSSQRLTETEMGAMAESCVTLIAAPHVEAVWIGESHRVAIGGLS